MGSREEPRLPSFGDRESGALFRLPMREKHMFAIENRVRIGYNYISFMQREKMETVRERPRPVR